MTKPTTEARRHGGRSGNQDIENSGDRKNKLTAEMRGRGESHRKYVFSVHSITRSPAAPGLLKRMAFIIRATLREIFDESAYDRFLVRTQASRSTASYRAFTRERDAAMAKKPRCC